MNMGKKILLIEGSPRKGGNSDILCDALIKGAKEAGHHAEKLYLQKYDLGYCKACYACKMTGRCVQKDGMDEIIEKLKAADVIVLSTPVYFYSMSGQMKTFIDRTLPAWRDIRDKEVVFIATAADGNEMLERTMDALSGWTDCLTGAKVVAKIYGGGVYMKGEIKGSEAEAQAYNTGLNL